MRSPLRIAATVSVLSLLLAGSLTATATAADEGSTENCPQPVPLEEVEEGMTGTGYTVADRRTRRSFSAEVVGVLPNGIGPGRDMIIAEVRGQVVEENGGIWQGMSGSPIFVGDRLLGAVAFGLTFGPQTIAGLTPGTEMQAVLNYPTDDSEEVNRRVAIDRSTRRSIAAAVGTEPSEVGGAFRQLKLPASISAAPQVVDAMARILKRENIPLTPFAGAAASGELTASAATLRPGDNLVAAVSYGDTTLAAIGTATFVCDGRVVGFGHPFLWSGASKMGLNAADSLVVIKDPFFSFELGTIGEGLGIIDQDRFAGVRGVFGTMPSTIPVTTKVHALNTDRIRMGRTDVIDSDALPFIAFGDVYGNILMTMDQYTAGSAQMNWTVSGTTESGESWTLSRANMHTSEYAISEDASFEIANILSILYFNQFEPIEFTGFDVDVTAEADIKQYTITNVLVSTDGANFADRNRIKAFPGDTIFVRVVLSPHGRGEDRTADLTVRVPNRVRTGGFIELRGGGLGGAEDEICFFDPTQCVSQTGKKIDSFAALLEFLQNQPHNNELVAKLRLGNRGKVKAEDTELLDQVVAGEESILVRVPGTCCGGGGRGEPEGIARPRGGA